MATAVLAASNVSLREQHRIKSTCVLVHTCVGESVSMCLCVPLQHIRLLFSTTRSGFRSECLFRVKPEIHVPSLFHSCCVSFCCFGYTHLAFKHIETQVYDVSEYGTYIHICVLYMFQYGEIYIHLFTRIHTTNDQPSNQPTNQPICATKLYTVDSLSRKRNGKNKLNTTKMSLVFV